MKFERSSGIILHPTSLPGNYGIGELGAEAIRWLEFLESSGCRLWQILPLGPTGYGDSPYQCFSAFAGNPYLISVESLMKDGLLSPADLADMPEFPIDKVEFGKVIPWKVSVLDQAFENFKRRQPSEMLNGLEEFIEENRLWLTDFALFMALKEVHKGKPWTSWDPPFRDRLPLAVQSAEELYKNDIERQIFRQFIFYNQWKKIQKIAKQKNIRIIGDVPIFVAHDSADVWANRDLFYLDQKGAPTFVAGVPPDYFSRTGQLWGNPLYRWDVHQDKGYEWWINRIKTVLKLVDIIRLDHFRGFAGYWEVPAGNPTAEEGRWVKGPGEHFFKVMLNELGSLPLIAEDLGEITPDVVELRDQFVLPGMKIFQFAFDSDSSNAFLPHNYESNCVVYTGTHDNDTTLGWFRNVSATETSFALRYLGLNMRSSEKTFVQKMIRNIWLSVAMFALAPLQDFLSLGSEARMNYPGRPSGNWFWRIQTRDLTLGLSRKIHNLNQLYGR